MLELLLQQQHKQQQAQPEEEELLEHYIIYLQVMEEGPEHLKELFGQEQKMLQDRI